MPRRPRIFVEGGIYHVYNKASHGEAIFADEEAWRQFVCLVSRDVIRDGHRVLAWCVMPTHYHLVIRSSAVALSRTFGRLQSSFGAWRNRGLHSSGPTWQRRYQAKLVFDQSYLLQLIAYVHANPVRAGLVEGVDDWPASGHLEVIGREDFGLIDREEVLQAYGSELEVSVRAYRSALASLIDDPEQLRAPGGSVLYETDRALNAAELEMWVDELGRSSQETRPRLEAAELIEHAVDVLGISQDVLTERSRRRALARTRFLVVGVGIERWHQSATELARIFDRRPDMVSWWAKRARELRLEDPEFSKRFESLDADLLRKVGGEGG